MDNSELLIKLAEEVLRSKEADHIGDAIKIGLPIIGTIIGGLIGYLGSKLASEVSHKTQTSIAELSRKTEIEKDFINRRSLRIDELIVGLDKLNQCVMNQCTHVKNWKIHKKNNDTEKIELVEKKLTKSLETSHEVFLNFFSAESKLTVMGQHEIQNDLREFGEYVQEMYRVIQINNASITHQEIDSYIENLREKRKSIYTKIGDHEAEEHKRILNKNYTEQAN
tara:strand:- start:1896 stop:2567 length:672 start_codon:yes stop_codon:yes gene_type:complete